MAKVDFAILCHSAVSNKNMISLLEGPIDTLVISNLPFQAPLTLAIRFLWKLSELKRPHRGEILFHDEDRNEIMKVEFQTEVSQPENSPFHWDVGSNIILNFPLIIMKYGEYRFSILIDDKPIKELPFRAIESNNG